MKESAMFSTNTLPLVILAGMFFLLYKAMKSGGERPFADMIDAEAALATWQSEHRYIHPGDYPSGRMLAKKYLDALLMASKMIPTMQNDREHLAKIEHAKRLAAPRQSGSFHAVA
jgi:hypothetical protein